MKVSVCVTAHQKHALLHECLETVRGIADEVLLAEVAGSPSTVSPDYAQGVRVLRFAPERESNWAAVLNETMDQAKGDWIFFLHAHERLARNCADLRQEIEGAECDAFSLRVLSLSYRPRLCHRPVSANDPLTHGTLSSTDRRYVRLFRRHEWYRFGGRLEPSMERSLIEQSAVIRPSGAVLLEHPILIPQSPYSAGTRLSEARDLTQLHPNDPDVWMDLGRCFLHESRMAAAAKECFAEAWRLRPEPGSGFHAAEALTYQQRYSEALIFLEEALSCRFENDGEVCEEDLWELQGEIYRILDRTTAASRAYRRALNLAPDRPKARIGLAEVLCEEDRIHDAAAQASWVRDNYPGLADTWIAGALVHLAEGKCLSAIDRLKIALDIEPGSATALYNLAIAYSRLGAHELGKKSLDLARQTRGGIALGHALHDKEPVAPSSLPLARLGDNGVVTFIPHLAGGAGRVAVDIIRSLHPSRPQVLITFDMGYLTGLNLSEELSELGVPVVSIGSGGQLSALLRHLEPSVVICHSGLPDSQAGFVRDGPFVISVSHGSAPVASSFCDRYVCLSESHRRLHTYLPGERVRIIPNGVDVDRFVDAEPHPGYWGKQQTKRTVRIAMLTRLDHSKFVRRLLHYLEPLKELDLIVAIAGQGPRRWEIQSDFERFGISSKVRFIGPIPSREVPAFLAAADIGLHLTETHWETLSIAILEMLAAGLPIVAQPRGCLPELIKNGVNGFLCKSESDISVTLRKLVLSKELRAQMGVESQRRAREYDIGRFDSNWQGFIDECLAEHQERREGRVSPLPPVSSFDASPVIRQLSRQRAPDQPPSYLIGTTPRTGGSLFCASLQATGLAGYPREDLAPWIHSLKGRSWRYKDLDDYLMTCWNMGASPRGVYGCRVMFNHFEALCRAFGTSDWPVRWLDRLREPVWVFLRRRDRVAQAISLYKAHKTGLWVDTGEPRIGVQPVDYDRQAIEDRREWLDQCDRGWEAIFRRFELEPIEICYEDMVQDLEDAVRVLLETMEIAVPDPLYITTSMRRQADDQTREWIERFRSGA
jgi:LPS sulfotransferase NodH/glycosyltransferase involved in cell wall biosynthesis